MQAINTLQQAKNSPGSVVGSVGSVRPRISFFFCLCDVQGLTFVRRKRKSEMRTPTSELLPSECTDDGGRDFLGVLNANHRFVWSAPSQHTIEFCGDTWSSLWRDRGARHAVESQAERVKLAERQSWPCRTLGLFRRTTTPLPTITSNQIRNQLLQSLKHQTSRRT